MLEEIWSLAKARLFVLYGGYVLVNIFCSLWINKNMPCIFPCASTEKSTRLFLCRYATKNPKVRQAWCITVLLRRCFARRLYRSPYNSRSGRINCAVMSHKCAWGFATLRPYQAFPSENLATACLNHSNVRRQRGRDADKLDRKYVWYGTKKSLIELRSNTVTVYLNHSNVLRIGEMCI